MANRINITQVENFNIHDKSTFAERWKKWNQSFEFYLKVSGIDSDNKWEHYYFTAQDIFMHLEDTGTTYKAAMDTLDNHFEPKKNFMFERHVFCQPIQGTNRP